MRILVQHGLKIPGPESYSSRQHSIAVDLDVPPEIAGDKERLKAYVANVGASVRSQVEAALGQPHTAVNRHDDIPNNGNGARRHVRKPHRSPRFSNGNGRRNDRSNDRPNRNGNTAPATDRQRKFLEDLRKRARYSPSQIDAICQENFECRLDDLSKKDMSTLLELLVEETQ